MEEKQQLDLIQDNLKVILTEIDNLKYGDLDSPPTIAQKIADFVVGYIGSWKFIIIQSIILVLWILANVFWLANAAKFDPYPFILLNLMLSFQAAYASPLVLMAQNRMEQKDRRRASSAYRSIEHLEKMMHMLLERLELFKNGNGKEKKNKS